MKAVTRFLTNPMIIVYALGNVFRYMALTGYLMFNTKYLEVHYRVPSSKASFVMGLVNILPSSFGIVIGGLAISWYKPSARALFTFLFLAEAVSIFTVGSGFFLGCAPIQLKQETTLDGRY